MKAKQLVLGALGIGLAFSALGDTPGWYGAVMAGKSGLEQPESSTVAGRKIYDSGSQGNAAHLSVGYRWNQFIALEVAYLDLGNIERSVGWPPGIAGVCMVGNFSPCNGRVQQKIDAEAFTTSLIGTLPVNDFLEVFAKIGVANIESRTTSSQASISSHTNDSSTKIIYGLGGRYLINQHWALRLEGIRSEKTGKLSDRLSTSSYLAGVEYRF